MLFTSLPFLLGVLPITVLTVYGVQKLQRPQWTAALLFGLSLAFYFYLDRSHFTLLLFSMLTNYGFGLWLRRQTMYPTARTSSRALLIVAIVFNIGILGATKYSSVISRYLGGFFPGAMGDLVPAGQPLGISFYTLIQLMYLIDCASGLVPRLPTVMRYGLLVSFFPYAYAGPIVKHDELIPQLEQGPPFPSSSARLNGWTFFAIGLFKKVVLANNLAPLAAPVFDPNLPASALSIVSAWAGTLAYMFQLYFDFSGYSDMAVGIGLILGVVLPFNFNSPLKATSIIDFWQRWHMTLTRFLTNYIYNPLVVSIARRRVQNGKPLLSAGRETVSAFIMMTVLPTLVTMLISGLWHGIEWKFIWLGVFHGTYLSLNHAYRIVKKRSSRVPVLGSFSSQWLTFTAVVLSIVFVRAPSVHVAFRVLGSMVGMNGWSVHFLTPLFPTVGWIIAMLTLIWFFPNSQEWIFRKDPASHGQGRPLSPRN
jgi:alginate O-acetyltransferase complex protein AlgI